MKPKISIVIPVYKVEGYIHQCIESVLIQQYDNIEIILVDDGSPDNCPKICDEYAEKFKQVKVIHKSNGGLSSARNIGIKEATGDYIVFLDSDDWLDKNYIKELVNCISEEMDIVVIKVHAYNDMTGNIKSLKYILPSDVTYKGINAFEYLYNLDDFWGAAWQFVVKRQFILDNKLFFQEGIVHEDEMYSPLIILSSDNIGFCNSAIYINRGNREGSLINSYNIKKEHDKIKIIKSFIEISEDKKFDKTKGKLLKSRCSQLYVSLIKNLILYRSDINNYIKLKNEIKEMKKVVLYNNRIKYKIVYIIISILGVKNTSIIINKLGGKNGY